MASISDKVGRMFATDRDKEVSGVTIRYGDIWVRLARMGESNKRFVKLLEEKMRPYRAMINNDVDLPEDVSKDILRTTYAEAILLGWGDFDDADKPRDVDYTAAEGVAEFQKNPDFFAFVRTQANKSENFKKTQTEADVKNSSSV